MCASLVCHLCQCVPNVGLLPVTCGNKNGILDVDKLGKGKQKCVFVLLVSLLNTSFIFVLLFFRNFPLFVSNLCCCIGALYLGDACIECEGRWFAPPAFEDLGGKGHSKKWKASIFHENKPLQFWFEVWILKIYAWCTFI